MKRRGQKKKDMSTGYRVRDSHSLTRNIIKLNKYIGYLANNNHGRVVL